MPAAQPISLRGYGGSRPHGLNASPHAGLLSRFVLHSSATCEPIYGSPELLRKCSGTPVQCQHVLYKR
jgi:hypothetical protein